MNKLSTKLAAAVTLVALGGLAGFALNANHGDAEHRRPEAAARPGAHAGDQATRCASTASRRRRSRRRARLSPACRGSSQQVVAAAPPPPSSRRGSQLRSGRRHPSVPAPAAPAVAASGEHEHESEGHDD